MSHELQQQQFFLKPFHNLKAESQNNAYCHAILSQLFLGAGSSLCSVLLGWMKETSLRPEHNQGDKV